MAQTPLRFIPIGAVLGDQEASESLSLPATYAASGSRNVYVDKYGRATVVRGYSKRNAAAVTSSIGGVPLRLRSLYHYGSRTGSALTRQLLGVFDSGPGGTHFELRKSTDGGLTWPTVLRDFGAAYVDRIWDFAQLGNQLVIATTLNQVQAWDGVTLSNATTSQNAAPITAATVNQGQLDGNYQWRIVPIKADGTRKAASLPSAAIAVNKTTATVSWAADAEAVSYEAYRTTGQGKIYFFETSTKAGVLSFISTAADLTLIGGRALQEYGDSPPDNISFVEGHAERMLYGRTDAYPRRWWYSDPGLPYSVYRDGNYIDFTDEESFTDVSTGGTGNYKGMFVCWLERSVWTVSGKGRFSGVVIDFDRRRTNAQMGTVSHRTVVKIPAGSAYIDARGQLVVTTEAMLAYLTPIGDLRLFNGSDDVICSYAKADTFKRLSYRGRRKAFAISDVEHEEVSWVFPVDGAEEPSLAVSWNLKTGSMTERSWSFACGLAIDAEDDAVVLLGGESNLAVGGYSYLLWDGPTNDNAHINAQIATRTFYGQDRMGNQLTQYEKRWRWVDLLVKADDGPVTLLVEWWPSEAKETAPAYGSVSLTLGTSTLKTADGSALRTSEASPLIVGEGMGVKRAHFKKTVAVSAGGTGVAHYLHARGLRMRISSATDRQWSLVGMMIAYQLLEGLKRDFTR